LNSDLLTENEIIEAEKRKDMLDPDIFGLGRLETVIVAFSRDQTQKVYDEIFVFKCSSADILILYIAYMFIQLFKYMYLNNSSHGGINADHGMNVNHTILALISLFLVLIYINSMICINSSVRVRSLSTLK
jgi:heme/copper-type cytochrome/quinol oxidase subunit 4